MGYPQIIGFGIMKDKENTSHSIYVMDDAD